MNRHSRSPEFVWPYRPRNTHLVGAKDPAREPRDEGFDDVAARLAGPGRALQQTMDAMVRAAVAQTAAPH
jgi:hypothetical protein